MCVVLLLLCIPFFDMSLYKVFFLSLALGRRKCCRKLPSPSPPTNECFHNPNFQHLPLTSSARCCWFKYRRDSLVQPLNSESIEMTGQCKGIGNKTKEILTGLSPSVRPPPPRQACFHRNKPINKSSHQPWMLPSGSPVPL